MLLRAPSVFEAQSNMERLLENLTIFTASPAMPPGGFDQNAPLWREGERHIIAESGILSPRGAEKRYIMNNASRNTTFSTMQAGTIAAGQVGLLPPPSDMRQLHLNTIYEAQDPMSGSCFNTPSIPITPPNNPVSILFDMKFQNSVNGIRLFQWGDGIDANNMNDQCQIVFAGSNGQQVFDLTKAAREITPSVVTWHEFSKAKCATLLNQRLQRWVEDALEAAGAPPLAGEGSGEVEAEYQILYIIGEIYSASLNDPLYRASLQKLMHDIIQVVLIKTKGDLFQLASSIHPQLATTVTTEWLSEVGPVGAVDFTNMCNLRKFPIQNPFDDAPKSISTDLRAMLHNDNSATLLNIELSEAIIRGQESVMMTPDGVSDTRTDALAELVEQKGLMCKNYIIASTVSASLSGTWGGV